MIFRQFYVNDSLIKGCSNKVFTLLFTNGNSINTIFLTVLITNQNPAHLLFYLRVSIAVFFPFKKFIGSFKTWPDKIYSFPECIWRRYLSDSVRIIGSSFVFF